MAPASPSGSILTPLHAHEAKRQADLEQKNNPDNLLQVDFNGDAELRV